MIFAAAARYVPNLLSIPFRSEVIHCCASERQVSDPESQGPPRPHLRTVRYQTFGWRTASVD
jgi:hypothetical protein